jgi:hypothetical protein
MFSARNDMDVNEHELERCFIAQMTEVIRNTNVLGLYVSAQTPTEIKSVHLPLQLEWLIR